MSKRNYISNKEETIRMFENDILEFFSKVHWSVPLIIYIPVVIFFIYRAFIEMNNFLLVVGLFLGGLIIWSLTEYILHRFLFHYEFKSAIGKRIHFIFHGVHHDYPNDTKRLVMPPSVSLPLAFIFYFLFKFIFGQKLFLALFSGLVAGYLIYDITHYSIHHFNIKNKFWLKIKNHHILHHYKDNTNGFGVSTSIWDYIFGTGFNK